MKNSRMSYILRGYAEGMIAALIIIGLAHIIL